MKKLLYLTALIPGLVWADAKVSNLIEQTSPKTTDYMYIVANSTSQKVMVDNLLKVATFYVSISSQEASNVVNQGQYLFVSSQAASNLVNQGQYLFVSSQAASNLVNQSQYLFVSSQAASNLVNQGQYMFVSSQAASNVVNQGQYLAASASSTFNTSLLQISSYTSFASSMPVSYLGISSGPNSGSAFYWNVPSTGAFGNNVINGSTVTAATIFRMPVAGAPQIDLTGATALDSTSDQLIIYNGAAALPIVQTTHTWTVSMSSGIGFYGSTIAVACAPANSGVTITQIRSASLPTGTTVQYKLDERAFGSEWTPGSNIFSAQFSTSNATGLETTSFNDSSLASGSCLYLTFPSTDTSKGSPISFRTAIQWILQRQ